VSYRITMNGELFCSSQMENTAILDPKVSLEVNKAGSLTFTILPDHPCYDTIEIRHSIFDVYQNDELIFEGIPVSEDIDFYNRKTVTCEGELTFLNDTVQRQAVYKNQTVRSLLAAYLSIHNSEADSDREFSLGSVTVDGGDAIYRYTNFTNTMTEIGEDLIDNFGGYLRVRHADGIRYLDYLAESPRTSTQEIRIGKNLIDLAKNLSTLNVITVLIPLGAKIEGESDVEGLDKRVNISSVNSGRDYIIADSVAYYGSIWGTVTWDGVSTPEALKAKAQEYLVDGQWSNLVISASAIDLGLTDEDVEQFRILDMIRVISEPHGINRLFMLTKLDIDLNHPGDTQITLGQEQTLSLSARSVKNTTSIEMAETRIMTNASENAKQILDSSTDGNIYFRFNDLGKVYEIDFLDSEDPETATKMWRWNLGGWGFYDKTTDTYTTAATMDGSFLANIITAGILKSDDGTTFYLDLDNGVLRGNFSELKIAGAAGATQAYADQAEADAISAAASNTSSAISTYDSNLGQQAVFNKLTNNGAEQGIYLQNGKIYINGTYIKANSINADLINGGTIASSNIDVTGSTMTDGKVTVQFTTSGRTYKSILKPAMLVNSYDYGSSHEEADVRYDRLQFVDGTTEMSSYEDVACTIRGTNQSSITILPPSASGKYITIQPVVVSEW